MDRHLDDIASEGRRLRAHSPEAWPLAAAGLAERLEREFDQGALADVAREINEVAHQLDCEAVAGASPLGVRIARASVEHSKNGLRVFDPDHPALKVLLVDGLLASGVQIARMAASAKQAGAKKTPAVVVFADPLALKRCRSISTDKVVALREF